MISSESQGSAETNQNDRRFEQIHISISRQMQTLLLVNQQMERF